MIAFSRKLLAWYDKNARDLPWRQTDDPYKIWVSEIMLQQTTVSAVIPYFQKWIKVFPDVRSVARASDQRILKMWQGLGYYQRARNLHKAAQKVCADYDGQLPGDIESLKKLPGFGPYTVGAVASIAFSIRYPIVDANVRRVVMRQLASSGIADTSQDKNILQFLETVLPVKRVGDFNQGLMELGALVCRTKEPLCNLCPVRTNCKAYKKGNQEIIPQTKKKVIKDINVAIGLIKNKNRYFIQRRPPKGLLADLWEFPGGKIEKGETSLTALKREMKEEIGVVVRVAKYVMKVVHFYTNFRVKLYVYECEIQKLPVTDDAHRWAGPGDFTKFPMPSGSARIVDKILGNSTC